MISSIARSVRLGCAILGTSLAFPFAFAQSPAVVVEGPAKFRVAIVGLVHGHVRGIPAQLKARPGFELVGIAEPDARIARAFAEKHQLDAALFHADVDELLRATSPQAVMVFTNTYDHRAVIEACARHRVPVMVEKPLATTLDDAQAIEALAAQAGIQVLVNYETTWYPSNIAAGARVRDNAIGSITKIVVNDGHWGPAEIGVDPEFLEWLRDPKLNGGGAMFDFGCYGANLSTWLMDGARPRTVTAIAQQLKPGTYARVDDECTIVLAYDQAQTIIQASWNWPFARKDIEIYGRAGYLIAPNKAELRLRIGTQKTETTVVPPPLAAPQKDALAHLRAVVMEGEKPNDLSSLENNIIVTEILDAARRSAASGRTIELPRRP